MNLSAASRQGVIMEFLIRLGEAAAAKNLLFPVRMLSDCPSVH